ncbi:hypothetical protein FQN49_005687, partial [Arthroderma sp. PD_2]
MLEPKSTGSDEPKELADTGITIDLALKRDRVRLFLLTAALFASLFLIFLELTILTATTPRIVDEFNGSKCAG